MMNTINKETQLVLEWLETETDRCIAHYPSDDIEELKDYIFTFMIKSGLSCNSIADTIQEFLRVALEERVDWEFIAKHLKSQQENNEEYLKLQEIKKKESEFLGWVEDNFSVTGWDSYLSINPDDLLFSSGEMLLESYNSLTTQQLEFSENIQRGLAKIWRDK